MNTRLLGALCIIGSLVGVADGVRRVLIGATHEGYYLTLDRLMYLGETIWLAGILCGLLGLIALKVTGTNPIFRLLSWLPVVGIAFEIAGGLLGLTGVPVPENYPLIFGQFLYMAGILVVAILVYAAKVWRGWRAFVVLLNVLSIALGAGVAALLGGLDGGWIITNAAASALLGYAVMTDMSAAEVRDGYALAASA
jgi:hypothetical protein